MLLLSQSFSNMFAKGKLRRQDFQFENGWFQEKVKGPGQLKMQQFQISDCQECSIFLIDSSACVYIDQCRYCCIFIGASQSSIFVRDCHHLTVICTTQQFRVRDCQNCHFSIFCESQPIIESSQRIEFSCFPAFAYEQLPAHMQETKTNPWNNNWFDVYDFTPRKFGTINFKLTDKPGKEWLEFKTKLKATMKNLGIKQIQNIIPRVIGKGQYQLKDIIVFVYYPVPSSAQSEDLLILQSRALNLSLQQQIALQIKLSSSSPKSIVLFVKIDKNQTAKWKRKLPNPIKEVQDEKTLEFYESSVFAPFKDQH